MQLEVSEEEYSVIYKSVRKMIELYKYAEVEQTELAKQTDAVFQSIKKQYKKQTGKEFNEWKISTD